MVREENDKFRAIIEELGDEVDILKLRSGEDIEQMGFNISKKETENSDLKKELDLQIKYVIELNKTVDDLRAQIQGKDEAINVLRDQEINFQHELEAQEGQFLVTIKKLESQIRELKRDRDILFESLHKTEKKPQNEVLKTPIRTPQSRIESLEALSKEILDFK